MSTVTTLATARSARVYESLRKLRGYRTISNDKQSIQSDTQKAWLDPSGSGKIIKLPRAYGNQQFRAGVQSSGYSAATGASNASLRCGVQAKGLAELTQERLKQLLHYNPDNGLFLWRVVTMRTRPGDRAGTVKKGYVVIGVDGKSYAAHRLAFLYMTGNLPTVYVDHKNSDGTDNRWANLRLATNSQNQMNVAMWAHNTSGFKGVSWHKREGRWSANIRIDGKKKSLGYFDDPKEGYAAYCEAARLHHGEFARLQ